MHGIKVSELIKVLEKLPKSKKVFMSSDAEGNNFANIGAINADDKIIIYPEHEFLDYEELK